MQKYEEGEKYWQEKNSKTEKELSQMYLLNKSLKNDCKEALTQLDKATKRIKQSENELAREKVEFNSKLGNSEKHTTYLLQQLEILNEDKRQLTGDL